VKEKEKEKKKHPSLHSFVCVWRKRTGDQKKKRLDSPTHWGGRNFAFWLLFQKGFDLRQFWVLQNVVAIN